MNSTVKSKEREKTIFCWLLWVRKQYPLTYKINADARNANPNVHYPSLFFFFYFFITFSSSTHSLLPYFLIFHFLHFSSTHSNISLSLSLSLSPQNEFIGFTIPYLQTLAFTLTYKPHHNNLNQTHKSNLSLYNSNLSFHSQWSS